MNKNQIIVVGGGPAGLMAAGQAAKLGAKVLLVEKMHRPGRKLRITGKGRCNITNIIPLDVFLDHFGPNGRFLRQAFARFFSDDLITFFHELGVPTVTERGGRIFPSSGDAKQVVDRLVSWVRHHRVRFMTEHTLIRLIVENNALKGATVQSLKDQSIKEIECDKVILATGGQSYPATGSTGDGYPLTESIGHTIVPVRPALVPLISQPEMAARLQELLLKNVKAILWVDGKRISDQFGEMTFTENGLTGPIILSLSKMAVDAIRDGFKVDISIDLKPALEPSILEARLLREINKNGKGSTRDLLITLLPLQLIPFCLEQASISSEKLLHQITADERKRILLWLKDFRWPISGYGSFEEAIITAGGISLKEVNPKTMESRRVKGLYFAGEILDLDGDTGGYNLQAAFSTGWLAGQSAGGLPNL